jgi:amino acid transporter
MNSVLCSQARLLQYLSYMVDFFPSWFAPMHRKFKTPYVSHLLFPLPTFTFLFSLIGKVSVITLGFICFFVSLTPFKTIMDLVVTLASISLLITYACLAFLRYKDPYPFYNSSFFEFRVFELFVRNTKLQTLYFAFRIGILHFIFRISNSHFVFCISNFEFRISYFALRITN